MAEPALAPTFTAAPSLAVPAVGDPFVLLTHSLLQCPPFARQQHSLGRGPQARLALAGRIAALDHCLEYWQGFVKLARKLAPHSLAGPILHLGSGAGNWVFTALGQGADCWGVEPQAELVDFFRQRVRLAGAPDFWRQRCLAANPHELPFASGCFSALYSLHELEHMEQLAEALREAARVTRRGGLIYLRGQDGRSCFEGHYHVPWLPFLPRHLARLWLAEFGLPPDFLDHLHYVTTPQVTAVLESCGCSLIGTSSQPPCPASAHQQLNGKAEVRAAARQARHLWQRGKWPAWPGALVVCAQKL